MEIKKKAEGGVKLIGKSHKKERGHAREREREQKKQRALAMSSCLTVQVI